jgi:hypothetical protein
VLVSKLDRLSRDVAFVAGLMAQRRPRSRSSRNSRSRTAVVAVRCEIMFDRATKLRAAVLTHATIAEIAAEKINASYVGRVLRLTLLAPDIVAAILGGRQPAEMTLAVLMKPFAVAWTEQRRTQDEVAVQSKSSIV